MLPKELVAKVHPKRGAGISGKFAAILGFLLDEKCTEPAIAELHVTSDGGVLAMHEGDIGCNDFIGTVNDLERNLKGWFAAVGCTPDELRLLQNATTAKITSWGPSVRVA